MRKIFVFIILMSLCGLCRAQERIYTLFIYTSEYSGPSVKLAKDIQSNPQMKATLEKYNFVEINAEATTKEDTTALKYYVFYRNEYPFFVVLDNNGNIIKVNHGYDSPSEFIETLDTATFGDKPYIMAENFDPKSTGQKKPWNDDWSKSKIFIYKL